MEKIVFKLILSEEAHDFINSQTKEVKGKIGQNIRRIQKGERNVELFKKLDGSDIWEFRTLYRKTSYRLFSFWDTEGETLVVATHGIVKKTQKTPAKDIAKAEDFRKKYFENKKKQV
ncbi:MAG: type II toxin-antitoxin system RelE/ParE family toxin [Prevotella sp.]|nr:type II toxin-antitoxin system RelE/ParE family toxin [Prevotella sp.]